MAGHPCRPQPRGLLGTREGVCWAGVVAGRAGRRVEQTGQIGQAWGLTPPCLPPAAQENLLLSVLPAHISMGMKLTIIERLKERGDRRYMPDNNFHSLYVKRHQNVRWVGGRACVHGVSLGAWAGSPPALLSGGPAPAHTGVSEREIRAPRWAGLPICFPRG